MNYLRQHADTIRSHLPGWAVGLLAPLGLGAGLSSVPHATSAAPPLAAASEKTGKSRGFLPIIALIILGLIIAWLWRSCQHKEAVPAPEPTAASGVEATTAAAPASLTLSTDDKGAVSQCQAGIGDQGFLATLQTQVKQVFSSTQDCKVDTSQTYAAGFTDKDALAGVLGALKGVPNASLEWIGDKITLKAGDAAALAALTAKVKALVPHTEVVSTAPETAEQSVSNSLTASQTALGSIDPNNVDVNALVKALNLQIINFATGSSDIPADNKAILDQAATLFK